MITCLGRTLPEAHQTLIMQREDLLWALQHVCGQQDETESLKWDQTGIGHPINGISLQRQQTQHLLNAVT